MTVIIGIDPHKASHTAVAIGGDEQQLAEIRDGHHVDGVVELAVATATEAEEDPATR